MPYLEGAKGVEITDSSLYDIQGNATFKWMSVVVVVVVVPK
jgi:hypothetical protein